MSASASSSKAAREREPSKRIPKKPIFPGEDKTADPKGPDKKKQKVAKPVKLHVLQALIAIGLHSNREPRKTTDV